MIDVRMKIKDILDRECYEKWHLKDCQQRDTYRLHTGTPCWVCAKNMPLACEIFEVSQKGVKEV